MFARLRLFAPETLFIGGQLLALVPFAAIAITFSGQSDWTPSYGPIPVYALGFCSFIAGTLIARRKYGEPHPFVPLVDRRRLDSVLKALTLLLLLQDVWLCVNVYSGIPLLSFLSGQSDVWAVNDAETTSGFGEVGVAALTLFLLSGAVALRYAIAKQDGDSTGRATRATAFVVALISSMLAGKRQGAVMLVVAMFTARSFCQRSERDGAGRTVKQWVLIGLAVVAGVWLMGAMYTLRVGESKGGLIETVDYLFYPTMNMSLQTADTQWGPGSADWLGAFSTLLPFKLRGAIDESLPRVVLESPSGFYSSLHWYLGPLGIVVVTAFIGGLCRRVYVKAGQSPAAMMAYGQIAWALIASHSYNHFLNLLYVPLPMVCFVFVERYIGSRNEPVPVMSTPTGELIGSVP